MFPVGVGFIVLGYALLYVAVARLSGPQGVSTQYSDGTLTLGVVLFGASSRNLKKTNVFGTPSSSGSIPQGGSSQQSGTPDSGVRSV